MYLGHLPVTSQRNNRKSWFVVIQYFAYFLNSEKIGNYESRKQCPVNTWINWIPLICYERFHDITILITSTVCNACVVFLVLNKQLHYKNSKSRCLLHSKLIIISWYFHPWKENIYINRLPQLMADLAARVIPAITRGFEPEPDHYSIFWQCVGVCMVPITCHIVTRTYHFLIDWNK